MKKSNYIKLILSIILSITIFATCKKDRIEDKPLKEYKSLNEYLDSKKQQDQEFIIDTPGKCPIIGKYGTQICPSKSNIMYINKNDSVNYPYKIKLIELYTPKDMIYYQLPSVGAGNILTTAGELRIRAYKDTAELVLRPSKSWSIVSIPNKATVDGMKQYYGNTMNNITDWTTNPIGDFGKTDTSYFGLIQKLGWIACDKDASSANSVTVTFASTTDNLLNVGIFIYIPSTKTVMQIKNLVSDKIPTGTVIKIIVFGQDASNDFYLFNKEMTLGQNNETLDISLSKTTESELTAKLDAL